ncbi:MAG: hypothetical protein KBT03_00095 [Bacteroidales bacterium]|nr:hypothetical protein [Candidatus Scybalousia scybalohippi]
MFNPQVKNLFFVNGNLSYEGFIIEHEHGVGYESYGDYSWLEFRAVNREGKCLSGETLEEIITKIDDYVKESEEI